ncbi:MAG: cupin domain-containing protein [Saprospiraceae bacterium]|nr:cupin domain-containing protein [Saprospiraceae bacterium]
MRSKYFIYLAIFIGGALLGAFGTQWLPESRQDADQVKVSGTAQLPTPGITQTMLLDTTLREFPGKKVTMFIGDFAPGASTPLHRHPGTELLYVMEGEGNVEQRGRGTILLKPGTVVFSEPDSGSHDFIHQATNTHVKQRMKNLVVLIHDVDGPPALPVGSGPNGVH